MPKATLSESSFNGHLEAPTSKPREPLGDMAPSKHGFDQQQIIADTALENSNY
jgi:hypothetical protein